jgi:hypothetical protein
MSATSAEAPEANAPLRNCLRLKGGELPLSPGVLEVAPRLWFAARLLKGFPLFCPHLDVAVENRRTELGSGDDGTKTKTPCTATVDGCHAMVGATRTD